MIKQCKELGWKLFLCRNCLLDLGGTYGCYITAYEAVMNKEGFDAAFNHMKLHQDQAQYLISALEQMNSPYLDKLRKLLPLL